MTCADLITGVLYAMLTVNSELHEKKLYCATRFSTSHEVKVIERCFEQAEKRVQRDLEKIVNDMAELKELEKIKKNREKLSKIEKN